jgi:hypothetical protein
MRPLLLLVICGCAGTFYACAAPVPDDRSGYTPPRERDRGADEDKTAESNLSAAPTAPVATDAGTDAGGEACAEPGASRVCNGACAGLQRCFRDPVTSALQWGACECGLVAVNLPTTRDCQQVTCPLNKPHPVGCRLTFEGGDGRGCVARTGGTLFLKEGNQCKEGKVSGVVYCSVQPATVPLDARECPMNREQPIYALSTKACPD